MPSVTITITDTETGEVLDSLQLDVGDSVMIEAVEEIEDSPRINRVNGL
jgi:hypothetical protein